jgi:hypothetical protein
VKINLQLLQKQVSKNSKSGAFPRYVKYWDALFASAVISSGQDKECCVPAIFGASGSAFAREKLDPSACF